MNAGLSLTILICVLAAMSDKQTRIYFGGFGLLMLGHYCATLLLSADNYNIYYITDAILCMFMCVFLLKRGENLFLKIVCLAGAFVNFIGWSLWHNSLSIDLYDNLYLGIYSAVVIYLMPRAYNDGINGILGVFRRLFSFAVHHMSKYLGVNQ